MTKHKGTRLRKVMYVMVAAICAFTMLQGAAYKAAKAADPGDYIRFYSDYSSNAESREGARLFNQEITDEGFILLKNDDEVLPLTSARRITFFGTTNTIGNGKGGSGKTLPAVFTDAGFNVNPAISNATNPASLSAAQWESALRYNDAAIVAFNRSASEGSDARKQANTALAPTEGRGAWYGGANAYTQANGNVIAPADGYAHIEDHILMLSQTEANLLIEVGKRFENIIVVLNTSMTFQTDFLMNDADGYSDLSYYRPDTIPQTGLRGSGEYTYDYTGIAENEYKVKIKGAIWIGHSGADGTDALGRILSGKVSPSARTVDTWAANFRKDPTFYSFAHNGYTNGNQINFGVNNADNPLTAVGNFTAPWGGTNPGIYQTQYTEGIYVGYRYYETRGYEEYDASGTQDTGWYDSSVAFPFGYGLSYTDFKWEIQSYTPIANLAGLLGGDNQGKIEIKVKVTNTGLYPGKDVVQLYYSAPYTGDVEKSHVVLGDFVKTKLLLCGQSQVLTLSQRIYDMSSYDMDETVTGANVAFGGDSGYMLEEGDYYLGLSTSAHWLKNGKNMFTIRNTTVTTDQDIRDNLVLKYELNNSGAPVRFNDDPDTGYSVHNRFEDMTAGLVKYGNNNNIVNKIDPATGAVYTDQNGDDIDSVIPWLSRADFAGTMPRVIRTASLTRDYKYADQMYRTINYNTGINGAGPEGTTGNAYMTKISTVNPLFDDAGATMPKATDNSYIKSDWYQNAKANGLTMAESVGGTTYYFNAVNQDGTPKFNKYGNSLTIGATRKLVQLDGNGDKVTTGSITGTTLVKGTAGVGEKKIITLYEMTRYDYNSPMWDEFLDQLTIEDLRNQIGMAGFGTMQIDDLGVPHRMDKDGPNAVTYTGTVADDYLTFASQMVVTSTWNEDIAYEFGRAAGNEAMWGEVNDAYAYTANHTFPSAWYAPGLNTHRSPFCGRNYEYNSEDGLLAGRMGAAQSQGARDMGFATFIKHGVLNDQETNRTGSNGLLTWATEQAAREIMFRAFEIPLRGPSLGMMSSFNKLGDVWAGASYEWLTEVMRGEWGFKGSVVTDGYATFFDTNRQIRAGNDMMLSADTNWPNPTDPYTQKSRVEKLNPDGTVFRAKVTVSGSTFTYDRDINDDYIPATEPEILAGQSRIVFEDYDVDVITQIAAMRNCAKNILYVTSRTSAMRNGAVGDHMITSSNYGAGFWDGWAGTANNFDPVVTQDLGTVRTGQTLANSGTTYQVQFGGLSQYGFTNTIGSYSVAIVAPNWQGVSPWYNGTLPDGLSINATSGRITGTVSASATAGVYELTIRARVDGWARVEKRIRITVEALTRTGETNYYLVQGTAGSEINAAMTQNSAGATVTYAVQSGTLPGGMSLDTATGKITGMPNAPGYYKFTVRASAASFSNIDTAYTALVIGSGGGAVYDDTDVRGLITALQTALGTLETSVGTLQTTVAGLSSYDDTVLANKVAALETSLTTLQTKIGSLETELGNLDIDDILEIAKEIQALNDEIAALQKAIDEIELKEGTQGPAGKDAKGCGSSAAAITAIFSLLACAFVVVIKKQF